MFVAALLASAVGAPDAATFGQACAALQGRTFGDLVVTQAHEVAAGSAPTPALASPNGGPPSVRPQLPSHCLATADIARRTGVGGQSYAIKIELRVPADWNGRFLYQGGGGMNGVVMTALGQPTPSGGRQPPALAQGFAVVSTDGGHQAANPADARFAQDQQAKLDYAYASIGKVSAGAKVLIGELTGRAPAKSYFVGCSNGGREALIAAQRFPTEFDGIIAANPGFELSHAAILSTYSANVFAAAAARRQTDASRLLTPADGALLQGAILQQCDELDGAKDGMIFDQARCRFDIRKIICKQGATDGCLATDKAEAIETAFRGPRDREGKAVVGAWAYDAGQFSQGWRMWQTGMPTPNGGAFTLLRDLVTNSLTDYFAFPAIKRPVNTDDVAPLLKAVEATAAMTDATSTDFRTFEDRGGKLILITGGSDPIFSAPQLEAWYGRMSSDMQASTGQSAADFARLFVVPGMEHCGGGAGLDDFDPLPALVAWTEGQAGPSLFVAKGQAFPGVTRPICAYPASARYDGNGPPQDAASFRCEAPKAEGKGGA
jgi:pimeloyl-ACP methyl ester carboxylesterase